jgi:hypothetical protein
MEYISGNFWLQIGSQRVKARPGYSVALPGPGPFSEKGGWIMCVFPLREIIS